MHCECSALCTFITILFDNKLRCQSVSYCLVLSSARFNHITQHKHIAEYTVNTEGMVTCNRNHWYTVIKLDKGKIVGCVSVILTDRESESGNVFSFVGFFFFPLTFSRNQTFFLFLLNILFVFPILFDLPRLTIKYFCKLYSFASFETFIFVSWAIDSFIRFKVLPFPLRDTWIIIFRIAIMNSLTA